MSKSKKVTMEKVTQVIEVKSNLCKKTFTLTAKVSPLCTSNTVQCGKKTESRSIGDCGATHGRPTS